MAKVITDNQHYADIAEAIRTKNETETLYKPSEMAPAILAIKGGVELNFSVVGNPKPSKPKANTIWVDTNTEITGWAFRVTAPVYPVEGMVWIVVGDESPNLFDVIGGDGQQIMVYPEAAKQYVDGAWEPVKIEIYQFDEWKGFTQWIFSASVDNTGGWKWFANGSGPTAVKNSDGSYTLTRPKNSSYGYLFRTVNSFVLAPGLYSTLKFSVTSNGATTDNWVGLCPSTTNTSVGVNPYVAIPKSGTGTFSVDVSALDGEFAFAVNLDYAGNGKITIADARFEV